jgi:hypothetical protein
MQIFYSELLNQIGLATDIMACGHGPCANIVYYSGPYQVKTVYVVFKFDWRHKWQPICDL